MIKKTVEIKIKEAVKNAGFKQQSFARKIGAGESMISQWAAMKKICTVLLFLMLLFGSSTNSVAARKGSYHRSSSSYKSTKPKTVGVKGYTRKNVTHVKSHTRSKPTKGCKKTSLNKGKKSVGGRGINEKNNKK
ncbi:MAG: hypothetical protein LBT58_00965 [Endomicrobium sp.]|jgi:hypothetical protein|nr:hypothetical protein [Endomicrobium sp.]